MDSVYQLPDVSKPTADRSPVTLKLLFELLAALVGEIADLPPLLGLFGVELESGLAASLRVAGDGC